MKKLHLLCNAHLDPVWLWTKNEGIAEAISTFRVAADFCDEYDGFVFNHNEALLYEWVENYEPELFERIKGLVKEGKWVIMGGWYLQSDCVMTSGESLLSQIELGREYFREKFGVDVTTGYCVDSFGHAAGLPKTMTLQTRLEEIPAARKTAACVSTGKPENASGRKLTIEVRYDFHRLARVFSQPPQARKR